MDWSSMDINEVSSRPVSTRPTFRPNGGGAPCGPPWNPPFGAPFGGPCCDACGGPCAAPPRSSVLPVVTGPPKVCALSDYMTLAHNCILTQKDGRTGLFLATMCP